MKELITIVGLVSTDFNDLYFSFGTVIAICESNSCQFTHKLLAYHFPSTDEKFLHKRKTETEN